MNNVTLFNLPERPYLPPLILLVQQPGLQLSHHDLPLPLGDGTASLVVGGYQVVDVWQVGLLSGQHHHLVLHRHSGLCLAMDRRPGRVHKARQLTACPVKTPDIPDCFKDWIDFMSPRSFLPVRRFAPGNIVFMSAATSLRAALAWLKPLITGINVTSL